MCEGLCIVIQNITRVVVQGQSRVPITRPCPHSSQQLLNPQILVAQRCRGGVLTPFKTVEMGAQEWPTEALLHARPRPRPEQNGCGPANRKNTRDLHKRWSIGGALGDKVANDLFRVHHVDGTGVLFDLARRLPVKQLDPLVPLVHVVGVLPQHDAAQQLWPPLNQEVQPGKPAPEH